MVYRQLLGDDFEKLAPVLQRLHSIRGGGSASGRVSVVCANRWLARLVGFPAACENLPMQLEVEGRDDRETWTRRFGNDVRRSVQRCENGLMVEDLGPLRVRFRVFADGPELRLESQSARCWILPVPVRVRAVERASGDGWEFEVHVEWLGSYRGVMQLPDSHSSALS